MLALYATLAVELVLIMLVSARVSMRARARGSSQHVSLRLVATPSWSTHHWFARSGCGVRNLLAFRVAVLLFSVGVMLHMTIATHEDTHIYLFFTIWNYLLQIVYWLLASVAGVRLLCRPQWALLESRADRFLSHAVWALFSVCLPASVIVSVVLWGVLLPAALRSTKPGAAAAAAEMLDFGSFAQHLLNTLLLCADFWMNHMLVDGSTLYLVVGWNMAYVLFEWVAHSQTQSWTYFFLALDNDTWLWYLALALVGVCAHTLACAASNVKRRRIAAVNPLADPLALAAALEAPDGAGGAAGGGAGSLTPAHDVVANAGHVNVVEIDDEPVDDAYRQI
jgi:hypothetical protein